MKKQLKVFVLTMMILLICCVGQVSATNDNSSLTYDGDEIIVNDIDNENILSSVNNNQKSSEEFYEVHVGQNITEDGGNGSYENPFATLDLACINVNSKGNVKINIFDGIYYVGSNLKFNTSNLLIQSINGRNVIYQLRRC